MLVVITFIKSILLFVIMCMPSTVSPRSPCCTCRWRRSLWFINSRGTTPRTERWLYWRSGTRPLPDPTVMVWRHSSWHWLSWMSVTSFPSTCRTVRPRPCWIVGIQRVFSLCVEEIYLYATTWLLALLLLICSTSLNCTPHHTLSAPLLTLASSVFRTDVKDFKDSAPFLFIGPSIWNNLPFSVRHAQTLSAFKFYLKTRLFFYVLLLLI